MNPPRNGSDSLPGKRPYWSRTSRRTHSSSRAPLGKTERGGDNVRVDNDCPALPLHLRPSVEYGRSVQLRRRQGRQRLAHAITLSEKAARNDANTRPAAGAPRAAVSQPRRPDELARTRFAEQRRDDVADPRIVPDRIFALGTNDPRSPFHPNEIQNSHRR